jgi:hypothetical protein
MEQLNFKIDKQAIGAAPEERAALQNNMGPEQHDDRYLDTIQRNVRLI